MSKFTHNICYDCWNIRNPDRKAIRVSTARMNPDKCCYCGKDTNSGIYIRDNPDAPDMLCHGIHKDD